MKIWNLDALPKDLFDYEKSHPRFFKISSSYINNPEMPHLLYVGPEGCGKTTAAITFAKQVVKNKLNRSIIYADDPVTKDERNITKKQSKISSSKIGGISGKSLNLNPFIHQRVMNFIKSKKIGDDPFKILIIVNFSALGKEQNAMRRIMEKYSKNCRIILTSSKLSNIIDPIISRCHTIQFSQLKNTYFNELIQDILSNYISQPITEKTINILRILSEKNIGKALTIAQSCYINLKTLHPNGIKSYGINPFTSFIIDIFKNLKMGKLDECITRSNYFIANNYFEWDIFILKLSKMIMKASFSITLKKLLIKEIGNIDAYSKDKGEIHYYLYDLFIVLHKILQKGD